MGCLGINSQALSSLPHGWAKQVEQPGEQSGQEVRALAVGSQASGH